MDKPWKAVERRIARWLGSERNPLSGRHGKISRSDSIHPLLYIETKWRKRHSAVSLWRDTAKKADKENKIPVCCLVEHSKHGFWLLVHSQDLLAVANQREIAKKEEA